MFFASPCRTKSPNTPPVHQHPTTQPTNSRPTPDREKPPSYRPCVPRGTCSRIAEKGHWKSTQLDLLPEPTSPYCQAPPTEPTRGKNRIPNRPPPKKNTVEKMHQGQFETQPRDLMIKKTIQPARGLTIRDGVFRMKLSYVWSVTPTWKFNLYKLDIQKLFL